MEKVEHHLRETRELEEATRAMLVEEAASAKRLEKVVCAQGTDKLEDCKRRNILYESSCMEFNPPNTLYKKGANLNNCEGVYVV